MSNTTRRRVDVTDSQELRPGEDGDTGNALAATRENVDQLFAVAARSFKSMTEGNSQEFLRRSRQTGGE